MKRVFLLIVVSALLVTLGFAQTPDAGSNTDQVDVRGCLGGSDGNYTVAEDGTPQIFKITTSSVDLKPHLGHDVKLIGHKASGAASSGAADNRFAVTELNMISEHCAATAAAPVVAVIPETVIAPAAPAATVSPSSETVSAPAVDAVATPSATVSPSSETVSAPAVDAVATPSATVSPSSETVSAPAVDAVATPPATVSPSSETVSTPAVDAVATPSATVTPSSEIVSPASAGAAIPSAATADSSSETAIPTVSHGSGSLWLLISFVLLVIVLATLGPVLFSWRKRKIRERTGTPNLSFTNEASSDRDKPEPRKIA